MKRIIVIAVLLAFLLNTMGYLVIFKCNRFLLQREMAMRIRRGNVHDDMVILKIVNPAKDHAFKRAGKKEFFYFGRLYDIIMERKNGDTTIKYSFAKNQDITLREFIRMDNYQETSNNGDDFKPFITPGITAQYNLHFGSENLYNHFSLGADYQSMKMTEHLFAVPDGDHINNNPVKYGGFNELIKPSTSMGGELGVRGEIGLFCKNLFDEQYFGFTEPNNGPDYNSYQAAPGRELPPWLSV